jgi:hypothetical protein
MLRRFVDRLSGRTVPPTFEGTLDPDEYVIASCEVRSGGHLVATSMGLWLPGSRRVGWHLISKATWKDDVLVLVEAIEAAKAGDAVVLSDLPPVRYTLVKSGRLPDVVHNRVTKSITSRHRQDLPGGGAWFVQRKVPGQDGIVLQVRPDPGTSPEAVEPLAREVSAKLRLMSDDSQQ